MFLRRDSFFQLFMILFITDTAFLFFDGLGLTLEELLVVVLIFSPHLPVGLSPVGDMVLTRGSFDTSFFVNCVVVVVTCSGS